jgi:hypothetical protein
MLHRVLLKRWGWGRGGRTRDSSPFFHLLLQPPSSQARHHVLSSNTWISGLGLEVAQIEEIK